MNTARLMAAIGAAGAVLGLMATWEGLGLPRPAINVELAAAKAEVLAQVADLEQQSIDTSSRLLNDQLYRVRRDISPNQRDQQDFLSKGEAIPRWLIDEQLQLDQQQRELNYELERLQP